MFELKPLSKGAVTAALEKAERYRLLSEAAEAESICRDVLAVEPDNQLALILLVLALTDQFAHGSAHVTNEPWELVPRLRNEYERAYYSGIICERRAKAELRSSGPGAGAQAFETLREALNWFEKAEALRPAGNDDALLRWNTCVRLIRERGLEAAHDDRSSPPASPRPPRA